MFINGTNVLLYYHGRVIAMQRGLSFALNDSLIDGTSKDSGGWAESIAGQKDAKIDFNGLFGTGVMPTTLTAKGLMDYLISRERLIVSVLGLDYPLIGQADIDSLSFEAPNEAAMTLSGSLKISGSMHQLSPAQPNLITDPDASGTDYDTMTIVGTEITSAINSAGDAYVHSNVNYATINDVLRCFFYLTLNSGQLPTVAILDLGVGNISNEVQTVAGLNVIDLTLTSSPTNNAVLTINNTGAANWKVSPIYLVKL